jgi:hypothetical protein
MRLLDQYGIDHGMIVSLREDTRCDLGDLGKVSGMLEPCFDIANF